MVIPEGIGAKILLGGENVLSAVIFLASCLMENPAEIKPIIMIYPVFSSNYILQFCKISHRLFIDPIPLRATPTAARNGDGKKRHLSVLARVWRACAHKKYLHVASFSIVSMPKASLLNHPLIFPIVKSMPYRSMGNRCYRHKRFMVAALDSFPMAATTYRPTFDDRCRRTSH